MSEEHVIWKAFFFLLQSGLPEGIGRGASEELFEGHRRAQGRGLPSANRLWS